MFEPKDKTFFVTLDELSEDRPCELHTCLNAIANLHDCLVGDMSIAWYMSAEDCIAYAKEHNIVFLVRPLDDDDFECIDIAVHNTTLEEYRFVESAEDVAQYEAENDSKKAFVEKVLSTLEEQAGEKVAKSKDQIISELMQKVEDLEEGNSALHQCYANASKARDCYQATCEQLSKQLEYERSKAKMFEEKYNTLWNETCDYEYFANAYDELRAEVEQLKQDNSDMMISYCDYRDAYSKKCEENKQLKKENEEYRCENVLLKNHLEKVHKDIDELEKEVRTITKLVKANQKSA